MRSVCLNGRSTTSLGFGGSLLGSTSPAASRKILQAAYDAGIRHFDVAPMYGFGQSERLLKDALGKRSDITITTKYGLAPPPHSGWIAPIHQLARKALASFPALKQRLRRTTQSAASTVNPPLTAEGAQRSIDTSLRELGVEKIDLLLLHEATPERLLDARLLDVLEENKAANKIGEFGIGSRSDRIVACLQQRSSYCRVVQYEWSVFSEQTGHLTGRARINHGSLGGLRADFTSWLTAVDARITQWSERTNMDLHAPGTVNSLLFKAALLHNVGHIVLFSTRSINNLKSNVDTSHNSRLDRPAVALQHLIHTEFLPYAGTSTEC